MTEEQQMTAGERTARTIVKVFSFIVNTIIFVYFANILPMDLAWWQWILLYCLVM